MGDKYFKWESFTYEKGCYIAIDPNYLYFADLQYARNLALYRDTYQSTTLGPHPADKAVDGNRYEYPSCTHTASETDPFWVVDLGEVYQIGHVSITNRKFHDPSGK